MAFSIAFDDPDVVRQSFLPVDQEFQHNLEDQSPPSPALFMAPDLNPQDVFVALEETRILDEPLLLAVVFAGTAAGGLAAELLVIPVPVVRDESLLAVSAGLGLRVGVHAALLSAIGVHRPRLAPRANHVHMKNVRVQLGYTRKSVGRKGERGFQGPFRATGNGRDWQGYGKLAARSTVTMRRGQRERLRVGYSATNDYSETGEVRMRTPLVYRYSISIGLLVLVASTFHSVKQPFHLSPSLYVPSATSSPFSFQ